jgi:hypothetical protein
MATQRKCGVLLFLFVAMMVFFLIVRTQTFSSKHLVSGGTEPPSRSVIEPHFFKYYVDSFSVMDISPLCFEQRGTQRHIFTSPSAQLVERGKCYAWYCADFFNLGSWKAIENRSTLGLVPLWIPGTTFITTLFPSAPNIFHALNQLIGGWHVSYFSDLFNLTAVDRVLIGVGGYEKILAVDSWVGSIIRAIWPDFNVSAVSGSLKATLPLRKQVSLLYDEFPFSFDTPYLGGELGMNHSICFERVILTGLTIFPPLGPPGSCRAGVMASTEAFRARVRSYVGKPAAHVAHRKLVFGRRLKHNSLRNGIAASLFQTEEAKLVELLTIKCALHNFDFIITGFSGSFRRQYEQIEDAAIFISIHGTILLNPCLFMSCNTTVIDLIGSAPNSDYFTNCLSTGVRYTQIKVGQNVNNTNGVFLSPEEWILLDQVLETAMRSNVTK